MTPLALKLAERIRLDGPITIADYTAACLGDPEHGYYVSREPFGRGGDFVTAPEVSQMFGELIGLWTVAVWEAMGSPARFVLAELGPGRGTLMADLLRAARLRPAFLDAAEVHFVETSRRLRVAQATALAPSGISPAWHDRLESIPAGPMILIANEFFDALPIRQFVRTEAGWAERMVGLDARGQLAFGLRAADREAPGFPDLPDDAHQGAIVEACPTAAAIVESIAARLNTDGGAALVIDYGYAGPATGDTLQAVRAHAYADPLATPGEADLTAHVDFGALASAAHAGGAKVHQLLAQGSFLQRLGLAQRAERLSSGKDEAAQRAIAAAAERLAGPEAMGTLFKALAISGRGLALPAFSDDS